MAKKHCETIVCADEKDFHTYEQSLKDLGIEYEADEEHLKIKVVSSNGR